MEHDKRNQSTEVAIIGAGPIGVELAIALGRQNVPYVLLEATQVGDAFMHWPPQTHFFSSNEHVALAGVPVHNLDQQSITGEQYLAYLRTLVEMFDVNLHNYTPVRAIDKTADGFRIRCDHRTGPRNYTASYVVLTTGGMAGPRLLNIPGEELPHVSHYFEGPHKYFRTRLLIVGGRNSAIEAALRCWRAGADVALSYRRDSFDFDRIKPHLSGDLKDRLEKGEITFFPSTLPLRITPDFVELAATPDGVHSNGTTTRHACDFVLLATGFVADMQLFEQIGVDLVGPERRPWVDEQTMQTNVPNLYVAGTAAGGTQFKFKYFISTTHDHVAKVVHAITGKVPDRLGSVPRRNNAVTFEEVKAN